MRHAPVTVDLDLLRKYNVPTPRYTSYPTALHFEEMDEEELRSRLADERASERPLSLYFHLPFCRKLCWYCACTRVITKDQSASATYLERLLRELEMKAEYIGGREVVQMHLGGGTPTFFLPEELLTLGERVRELFDVAGDAEISVEIDPRELTREHVDALQKAGFNRASLGVQDNNEKVQKRINRVQPFELTRTAVDWLREAGFRSINFDLVYGLPGQTIRSFEETLREVVEVQPDRFAIYSYAHVPWAHPAQKLLEREETVHGPELKLALLKLIIEKLTQAGYAYIGMDHFALPDDDLAKSLREGTLRRNFQGYSTRAGTDIHASGMSAISQTCDMYFQNDKELPNWEEEIDAGRLPVVRGLVLSRDDEIRRDTIMEVMCQSSVNFDAMSDSLGVDFAEYFAEELASLHELEEDGLVRVTATSLEILPRGRLFLRNIASYFDACLGAERERYSRAI